MSDHIPHIEGKDSENQGEGAKSAGGPLGILFPADLGVWHEARRLVTDKNLRVDDLSTCACQDPSIVIELIKISNAMYFSAGRQPITSTRTAIVRLGSDVVLDCLEKMKSREQIADEDISHWFEIHRSRCKRTSLVARMLAESLAKTLSDECQAVGLLMYVGEMLAVMHLGERYVALAEELSRSGIIYRLAQDFKFDVERMGINYLRRQGIPEALLFAIDREGRSKSADKAIMKPLCMAAGELVEAFDANRWDKLAPGKQLPPKSALRMLPMNENQYLKIYERAGEYLFTTRSLEEKKKQVALSGSASPAGDDFAAPIAANPSQVVLQNEIQDILKGVDDQSTEIRELDDAFPAPVPPVAAKSGNSIWGDDDDDVAHEPSTAPEKALRDVQFSLKPPAKPKNQPRIQKQACIIEPPRLASNHATAVVSSITTMLNQVSTSEELLSQILGMLVDTGPFEKTALIVVSQDRTKAIVVAARGPKIGNGQKLDITDPLSPLAQCFSKVQSFGNKEAKCSPFGSKSFALAPVDADHETPVALYADCGNDGAISFEARRIFRTVIEILNEKLPLIPGGIPVELN